MLNRTADLHIYAHPDMEMILPPQLDYFCAYLPYKVIIHPIDPSKEEIIYEDRSITVTTIPLCHRIPSCGFLFEEKPLQNNIIKEMVDFYKVPVYEYIKLKNGEDYVTPEGEVIPNDRLTRPSAPARKYAYCSDTKYYEKIIEQIKGVDLLFHEATFIQIDLPRAKETCHTTARQAGEIAKKAEVKKLMIGHFSARYDDESELLKEASEVFPNTILAKENLRVSL